MTAVPVADAEPLGLVGTKSARRISASATLSMSPELLPARLRETGWQPFARGSNGRLVDCAGCGLRQWQPGVKGWWFHRVRLHRHTESRCPPCLGLPPLPEKPKAVRKPQVRRGHPRLLQPETADALVCLTRWTGRGRCRPHVCYAAPGHASDHECFCGMRADP